MHNKTFSFVLAGFSALMLLLPNVSFSATFERAKPKQLDVRVLVDISQELEAKDPNHYRQSALKLFTELLPRKAKVGIWTFDGETKEVLSPELVTDSWRGKALKIIDKIGVSSSTQSNLEKALAVTSLDWVEPNKKISRHIILLSDGQIDVGNKKRNLASKSRIQNSQIKRLNSLGVTIHTIGVSNEADQQLLDTIAVETGGWFDMAKSPEHLSRTLLRVNKRLSQRNSAPIVANKFMVDEGIREFTAVVFRKKGFGSTALDDPDGMDFGQENKRKGVLWHREKSYDIVTVSRPMEGEWKLIAPVDADNQVFIKTRLQMVVEALPPEIFAGDDSRLRMLLSDSGRLVSNNNFLDIIKATVDVKLKNSKPMSLDMQRDMISGGYFFVEIGKFLPPGVHNIIVSVKGPTFERQESLSVRVKPKPVVKYIEVKPEFRQVLSDAGIQLPENGVTEHTLEACPDLAALLAKDNLAECKHEATDNDDAEEGTNWLVALGVVLFINVLFAIGGFFGFKFYKKKIMVEDQELINKISV